MCNCGGWSASLTCSLCKRMASPTRRPVLARRPSRLDKVRGRKEPRGRLACAASKRVMICVGVQRIGFRPSWGREQPWGWHFGIGCGGLEVAEKPPRHTQTSRRTAGPSVRRMPGRPIQGPSGHGSDAVFSWAFTNATNSGRRNFLGTHLESEGFAQAQVGYQLGIRYRCS